MTAESIRAVVRDEGQPPPPIARVERDALQVLPTLAGSGLLLLGLRRRGLLGNLIALAGAGMMAQGIAPALRESILRNGAARRRIDLTVSVLIDRPVPVVFAFCTDFSNFPTLVTLLEEVEDFGDGRSRWVVRNADGSYGVWEAMVTKFVPNQVIAWESVAEAPIESHGIVRFHPLSAERSELTIHFDYAPKRTSFREAWRALLAPERAQVIANDLSMMSRLLDDYDPTVEPAPPEPMVPSHDGEDG